MTNIELLESILRNNCPFILDNLQSGLSVQQIGEFLTDSSLNYDEIGALYSWRNGMSEQCKPCFSKYSFHPFGNLIPLNKAVLLKKKMKPGITGTGNFFRLFQIMKEIPY